MSAAKSPFPDPTAEIANLRRMAAVLAHTTDVDQLVEDINALATELVDARGALIALIAEEGGSLRVAVASGSVSACRGRAIPEEVDTLIMRAVGAEQPVLQTKKGDAEIPLMPAFAAAEAVVLPLAARGTVVGALACVDRPGRLFDTLDIERLTPLSTLTALALGNARFVHLVRRAKQEWEAAFDALHTGLAVLDSSGRIVRLNRTLAQLAGAPIQGLIGSTLREVGVPDTPGTQRLLEDARAGVRRHPIIVRNEAQRRSFRISASPYGQAPAGRGIAVVVEDVTEERALEAQLIQSEKLAAVGQLVSGVAHELNNPLTSISGLSELLLEQLPADSPARRHVEVIHQQALRSEHLVRTLLRFARKGPAESVPVDVNEIVRSTLRLMERDIEQRGVDLQLALQEELPSVRGDPHQIQQLTVNLLNNAVQAVLDLDDDAPRLVLVETESGDGCVELRVTDSGAGIPEAIAGQIFAPFFTTKEPGKGTGLGLWMSQGIAEGHGGELRYARRTDQTVFTATLPAPFDTDASGDDENSSRPASRHRLLLVDDDPVTLRMVTAFFSHEGHDVTASSPMVALSQMQSGRYALLLADTRAALPSGDSVLAALARLRPDLRDRLLAATDDLDSPVSQELEDLGVDCIAKPLNLRELRATLERVLARSDS